MKITKVNKNTGLSKLLLDKTDWKRVYQKSQSSIDQEAIKDKENPVIKTGKVRRLNDNNKL